MVPNDKIKDFIESMARRDRRRVVPEADVRAAIKGYVRCAGIANRLEGELSQAQLERAVRYYRSRCERRTPQLDLLSA
ncbi:MAG: hypothetical protein ACXWNK_00495 [Vulcanimicrobiaceae bacterium]